MRFGRYSGEFCGKSERMINDERVTMNEMKDFSVCYDKFCLGRYSLAFDEEGKLVPFEGEGAFEMYLLSMWNDGMVVTMKGYDEKRDCAVFVLLLPDGSEQVMENADGKGFGVTPYRCKGEGRFAYLLEFLSGLEYKGFRGYEEYDDDEGMIFGTVTVGDEALTYGGVCFAEVKEDFVRVIEGKLES